MATKNVKSEQPTSGGISGKAAEIREFFEESKGELKKVTWPTKSEIKVTTLAVLILVVIMSLFLGTVDLGLVKLVELILGR